MRKSVICSSVFIVMPVIDMSLSVSCAPSLAYILSLTSVYVEVLTLLPSFMMSCGWKRVSRAWSILVASPLYLPLAMVSKIERYS